MKNYATPFLFSFVLCLSGISARGQAASVAAPAFEKSGALQKLVERAAAETLDKFTAKGFKKENLAFTLIDLRDPQKPAMADFHGEERFYPASVVKLFYDVALHQRYKDGKLKRSPALDLVEKDMIVSSYNEATQFMVDLLTGTSNGVDLPPDQLKLYGERRNVVNRYFAARGYRNINVNQKTYNEAPYGREKQWVKGSENRNMLTTNATARLLTEIALGQAVSPEHSREIMELLKRDWQKKSNGPEDQEHGFTAIALEQLDLTGTRLWAKAGWTSTTRHDAAYLETPDGRKFVLVTFTSDFANEREILPNVARIILENLRG